MPLVKIEILAGHSARYKKDLLECVHQALENALGIEDWDRFQRLYELDAESFERSGSKTEKFTMIHIEMFRGRTREQKAKVFSETVRLLEERLGIANTDVFIVINEPPDENWGLAGIQRLT